VKRVDWIGVFVVGWAIIASAVLLGAIIIGVRHELAHPKTSLPPVTEAQKEGAFRDAVLKELRAIRLYVEPRDEFQAAFEADLKREGIPRLPGVKR